MISEKIRALVFDLDGTLLRSDKSLSPRNKAALQACEKRGCHIIIATGRSIVSGERVRAELGISGPQVYYNGAMVADMPAGGIVKTRYVSPEPLFYCLELSRKKNVYFQVYFPPLRSGDAFRERLITEKIRPEAEFYEKSTGIRPERGDLEAEFAVPGLEGIAKAMFITEDREQGLELDGIIREKFGNSVSITWSSPIFMEILASGVTKGSGLRDALAFLGLEKQNALAFGDEVNDLALFEAAGLGAAMGNAKKPLLEKADFVLKSNDEDGVACFLEEHFGI